MNSYILTADAVTVFTNGRSYSITNTHDSYTLVLDALKKGDYAAIPPLVDAKMAVAKAAPGRVVINNDKVFLDGKPVHPVIQQRIINQSRLGLGIENLSNFLIRLEENPSSTAREELYLWMETSKLPINEDGTFLAYKVVRNDYKDKYTGTMDNSIGAKPSMPRRDVDDNRTRTCSYGLHFCSLDYLNSYGRSGADRVMILKIDPADVVSIPIDYNNKKGRACAYEVVDEYHNYNWLQPTEWTPNEDEDEEGWDEDPDILWEIEGVGLTWSGEVIYQETVIKAATKDEAMDLFWDLNPLKDIQDMNTSSITIRNIVAAQ